MDSLGENGREIIEQLQADFGCTRMWGLGYDCGKIK